MNENMILSLIAGAMVLVLLIGNLSRRNMKPGQSLKLALIWIAIIAVAALAVTLIQRHR